MDYLLKNQYVCAGAEILDTVTQQAVDLDFTLPDYCADIEKILKCTLVPKIYTRTFSAGQLRVDGASVLSILYCDSNKKALRCCEQTVPFSATIPVSEDAAENAVITTAKPEYLNCRALTPRRLTVHGAFSLYTAIHTKRIYDIKKECSNEALQIKTKNADVFELCELNQEQFNVAQTVNLRPKNAVESIVRSDVTALVTDFQQSSDKLLLKGEVTLRMLYICDAATGEVDQFIYVFPFSQSIDSKDSDCTVTDVRLDVLTYELLLRTGVLTEEPSISIDLKMCASVSGYKQSNITFITDAYSVAEHTRLSVDSLTLSSEVYPLKANCAVKSSLQLGERQISKIMDIFWEEPAVAVDLKDGKAELTGKVKLCILATVEDGELVCIERQADIKHSETLSKVFSVCKHIRASVTSVSYRMAEENTIDVRLDMQVSALLSNSITFEQVVSVEGTGETDTGSYSHPLTLYYAHKGEQVWEIAKRYSTLLSSLCEENSIEEEELTEARMLMIVNA
ncbi:MAG: DUF3794 domain-containing protein [Ruminococcus sp.]|nr:DUF3794 domain-containing protein [Ruminococcus sp.]